MGLAGSALLSSTTIMYLVNECSGGTRYISAWVIFFYGPTGTADDILAALEKIGKSSRCENIQTDDDCLRSD